MRDVPIVIGLAVREWFADWQSSLCLAIGVTAAAAPLLLLLSIRTGIVSQMRAELDRFPASRELVTMGEPRIAWPMVAQLAKRPDVAFVTPLTRLLSASAVIRSAERAGSTEVDLIPSGGGDPLAGGAWHPGTVMLSEPAARELGARVGDRVSVILTRRTMNGVSDTQKLSPVLAGVIPANVSASSRRFALLDQRILSAIEIWRENADAADIRSAYALAGRDGHQRRYAGLRLYARSIDDVDALRQLLTSAGIETESRAEEIRLVQRLDRGLTIILAVIALVIAIGLCLSLAVAQWGWVLRKRAELSYLRLIGIDGNLLVLFPLSQAVLTVAAGLAMAAASAWGAHLLVNALFAGQLGSVSEVSRVDRSDLMIVSALSLVAAVLAAATAAGQARRTTPVMALRGV